MRTTCFGLLIFLLCAACSERHDHKGRTPLVELDGNFLYREDLQSVLPTGLSKDDSLLFAEHISVIGWKIFCCTIKRRAIFPITVRLINLWRIIAKLDNAYLSAGFNTSAAIRGDFRTRLDGVLREESGALQSGTSVDERLVHQVPLTAPQLGNVRRWYKMETREAVEHLEKYSLQNCCEV